MNLDEYLRRETKDILDSLEKLNNETLPSLQREKDACEKDKRELTKKEERASAALLCCDDELDRIGERLKQLRKRQDQLFRRRLVLERGRDACLDEANEPKARIEVLNRRIQETVKRKEALREQLKAKRLEAFAKYLGETRERLNAEAVSSKELESKRASRADLEAARHSDPKVMELWERRVELKTLIRNAKIHSNRLVLEGILHDIERSIEQLFPGALAVEEYDLTSIAEEILYSSVSETEIYIFLPFDKGDLQAINVSPVDRCAIVALRFAYALGKLVSLSPGECKIEVGKHRWAILRFPRKRELINCRFTLELSREIPCPIIIHPLPSELEELLL